MKRLISRYYHALAIGGSRVTELGTDFNNYQEILTQFKRNATSYFEPLLNDLTVSDGIQQITERLVLKHAAPFHRMELVQLILLNSVYSIFLRNWLMYFPKNQIHLVNGNQLGKRVSRGGTELKEIFQRMIRLL